MIPFGFFQNTVVPANQPIPGMAIWLKPGIGVYTGMGEPCTGDTGVAIWQDQSGNGNNMTTTGAAPLYQTNALNGFPSVYFNGNQLVSANTVSPKYVFFVVNIPSDQQGYSTWNVLLGLENSGGDGAYIARLNGSSSDNWDNDFNNLCGVYRANGGTVGTTSEDGNPVYNDVFTQYTAGPNPDYTDSDHTDYLYLGESDSRPIVAQVVEIIVYDMALTDAQIAHVENYLNGRYALWPTLGMQLWLRADEGAENAGSEPCSDGDNVATWNDQSGNTNNATVLYNYPTFKASSQNGLPTIQWNGGGNQGLLVSMTRTFPETQFYVVYDDPSDSGDRSVADGDQNCRRLLSHHGSYGNSYPNWSLFYNGSSATNETSPQGTWGILTVIYNGDSSVFRVNGVPVACSLGNVSSSQLTIGNDGGFVTGFVGYISEVLIYPTALPDVSITENYLSAKYNLIPDYGHLIRWWNPTVGFDGSANWVDTINSDFMSGSATTTTLGNNAKVAILCTGGTGLTTMTTFSTPISVYYVAKPLSLPSGRVLQGVADNWLLGFWAGNQSSFFFDGSGAWLNMGNSSDGNPHIYGMTSDGSVAQCFADGSEPFSGTDGVSAPNGLCVGASGYEFGDEWTPAVVGDIIIYNIAHDATTAKTVMAWLNAKYGVY